MVRSDVQDLWDRSTTAAAQHTPQYATRGTKPPAVRSGTHDIDEAGDEVAESDLVHVRGPQARDIAGDDRGGVEPDVLKDVLLGRLCPEVSASVLCSGSRTRADASWQISGPLLTPLFPGPAWAWGRSIDFSGARTLLVLVSCETSVKNCRGETFLNLGISLLLTDR